MTVTLKNKSEFVNHFLVPLSKIDDACIVKFNSKGCNVLLSASDNTVILYGVYEADFGDIDIKISIPDLKRLIQILSCITDRDIDLDVDECRIKYESSDLRFTYHLLDQDILSAPAVSVDKIKSISYDTFFSIPYNALINLLKSSAFTLNINKVYFYTKGDCVYAEINDKQAHNTDSICIKLCDEYNGSSIDEPLPVSFDTIRTLSGLRCDDITVRINPKLNVMTFNINIDNINMMYIISGLIK